MPSIESQNGFRQFSLVIAKSVDFLSLPWCAEKNKGSPKYSVIMLTVSDSTSHSATVLTALDSRSLSVTVLTVSDSPSHSVTVLSDSANQSVRFSQLQSNCSHHQIIPVSVLCRRSHSSSHNVAVLPDSSSHSLTMLTVSGCPILSVTVLTVSLLGQVHTACMDLYPRKCPLGQCKVSIIPPTALNSIDSDGRSRSSEPPRSNAVPATRSIAQRVSVTPSWKY